MPELETPARVFFTCVNDDCDDSFADVTLTEALPAVCSQCGKPARWALSGILSPQWKAPRDYEPLELKPTKKRKVKRIDLGGEEAAFVLVVTGPSLLVETMQSLALEAFDKAKESFSEAPKPCGCNHDDDGA